MAIRRTDDGRIVFLQTGDDKAGLAHVILKHATELVGVGISIDQIPDAIMTAIMHGRIIGYQGQGFTRPIYEFEFQGRRQYLAITTSENGFIVGANPPKERYLRRFLGR